jgi:hypothetical protein
VRGIAMNHRDFDLASLMIRGAKIQLGNDRPINRWSRPSFGRYEALLMQGLDGGVGGSLVLRGPRFLFHDHGLHLHHPADEPLSVNGAFLLVTLGAKQSLSFRFAEKEPGLVFKRPHPGILALFELGRHCLLRVRLDEFCSSVGFSKLSSHGVVGLLLNTQALMGDLFMSLMPNLLHRELVLSQSGVFKSLDYYAVVRCRFVKRCLLALPKRVQLKRRGMAYQLTGFSKQPMLSMMHTKHHHPGLLTLLFQHVDETGM